MDKTDKTEEYMTNFMLNSIVHAETICTCLGCIPKNYKELEEKSMKWLMETGVKEAGIREHKEINFGKYDVLWEMFGKEFFEKAAKIHMYKDMDRKKLNKILQKQVERFTVAREVLAVCLFEFLAVCKN